MKKILLSLLCLLTAIAGYAAKTAKAVVSANETTLTFYYDDADHSSEGNVFALKEGSDYPGWYIYMGTITTAVFDASFKDARPTTTYMWFSYAYKLETIKGIENLNTSEVTNMSYMFYYCKALKSLDLSSFNTENVTYMSNMFYGCEALKSLDLSNFNTAKVTMMSSMFYGCGALESLDLSSFNTANVTDMDNMFRNCAALTSLDLSSFNTAEVIDMSYMFYNCKALTSLDLSSFNTAKVTNMNSMFYSCKALTSLDLSNFNNEKVTNMYAMFRDCSSLTSIDLSSFNTAKVTNMSCMFYFCKALKSLDLSSFNTANVTDMGAMFRNCAALTSLDLSSFNTAEVIDMSYMFAYCTSLKSIDLSSFNTENVTYMNSMFENCNALTSLDLSNFNTAKVTNMGGMFYSCKALTSLDLSNFNTANVTNISYMFYGCKTMTTIYVSENFVTTNVNISTGMFNNCSSLVGGAGTTYDEEYTDVTYAKIDGGENDPGYFTYKAVPIKLTIGESRYATFCSTKAVDFSDQTDFKAYIVSSFKPSTKETTLTQVNNAPAGTGILVIGTPGTYSLTETTSAGIYSNFLVGVTEATTLAQTDGSNTNFVLADGSEGIAFYMVDADGGDLAAGKAYLSLPTTAVAGAKTFRFIFDDEETTAISGISADGNASNAIYNLAGQKVDDSYKGIVIINGKKIMRK